MLQSFGHELQGRRDEPLRLREVSLVASPQLLRALAAFLSRAAETIEAAPGRFGHAHFRDEFPGWQPELADVIVIEAQSPCDQSRAI